MTPTSVASHAVVTGGGTGIGAAIARRLARMGSRVTVIGRRSEPLAAIVREIGDAAAITCDVTQHGAVQNALGEAVERYGAIKILVNNAGAVESAPLGRSTEALFRRMLDVNLMGAVHCSQVFLAQHPLPAQARIVNVASTAGLIGYPYVSAYCAAKHGLIGFTRALAREFALADVTINAVCPGYTHTDLLDGAIERISAKTRRAAEDVRTEMASSNPQGRLIEPHEVAGAVAWLALPESAAITGQTIVVAGGEVT